MKRFALFLPQYHEIIENNRWWGKGFTEWTNVKNAKPLFHGHCQPQKPLNGNYYNLLNKSTVEWQTNLMQKYGLNGFAYYHYYFCGKKILEKPAENLLRWKEIRQPFFFCWANHTWYRSWNNSKEVLMEQTYGTKTDWKQHILYLLPFFKDDRYEKKNNKPVFMLFQTDFKEKKEMIAFFDLQCKRNGFDGIYLIETYFGDYNEKSILNFRQNLCDQTELIYIREPSAALNTYQLQAGHRLETMLRKVQKKVAEYGGRMGIRPYNGNQLYDCMIDFKANIPGIANGVFFEWDNTPRHSLRGYIITPPKKEKFFEYMDQIKDDEYVFINAWNEWAEGMVLEPTEQNGYKYLEWIKEWTDTHENKEQL
ncbi:MAG: polysaccharide biosynthesis protein [Eubacterium sp.]|jgi:hypothetical protein|nr:polysaccharide biosynthesis protein [Eubacterium sp.]